MNTIKIQGENKFYPFKGLFYLTLIIVFCIGFPREIGSDYILWIIPISAIIIGIPIICFECFSGEVYISEILMTEDHMTVTRKKRGKICIIETLEYSEIKKCHLKIDSENVHCKRRTITHYTTEFTAERIDNTEFSVKQKDQDFSGHPYRFALYIIESKNALNEFTYEATGPKRLSIIETIKTVENSGIENIKKNRSKTMSIISDLIRNCRF